MAWNADATRMPYRMHSEYLRQLFLGNDFAEGRYLVDGRPVALSDIRAPLFVVATLRDHVAPWRSVHKLHLLTEADLSFVLSSGGHNVGIVNPSGVANRSYQMSRRKANGHYVDPETWAAVTPTATGSWWPAWCAWLAEHSTSSAQPPSLGRRREDIRRSPTHRDTTFWLSELIGRKRNARRTHAGAAVPQRVQAL
jgi:polyhydroxyalkanoate synthase